MNKIDLLKKLKCLSLDNRGNENERKSAEEQLNKLIKKYNINPNDINEKILIKRDIYFKELWEKKLICQTIYMLFPEKDVFKNNRKRNWLWCEMTDAEYLEFETHYYAYKNSFEHELELFYTAFISKNNIYPNEQKIPKDRLAKPNNMSRGDRLRASMMMEGIETTRVRRELNEPN